MSFTRLPRSRRGSVLLVAIFLTAGVAIALGSYLRLATQATRLSQRTLFAGAAMNVAESGLEEAMWSANKSRTDAATAWTGWTLEDGGAKRTFDYGTLSGGGHSQVKVYVSDTSLGDGAFVISRGIVTPSIGEPVERWVRIQLKKRSPFANGTVGNTINLSKATFDSYDSSKGAYGAVDS